MRAEATAATVSVGLVREGFRKSASVTSDIGAPLMGGFEWQPWQRVLKTVSTAQGIPSELVGTPLIDPSLLVLAVLGVPESGLGTTRPVMPPVHPVTEVMKMTTAARLRIVGLVPEGQNHQALGAKT
jgi:hypothetical protein